MRFLRRVSEGAVAVTWRDACCFDPGTMLATTMGLQAIGGGISAASTIAGGNAAAAAGQMQQNAYNYQAAQVRANEGSEIGAAQRQMLDKQLQTKQLQSTIEARAAGGGVNAAVGSPLATEKSVASRGTYQSLMDLWNGENRATGMENEAKGLVYSGDIAELAGEEERNASRLNALSTVAGAGSSMLRTYGAIKYPMIYGRPGIGYG